MESIAVAGQVRDQFGTKFAKAVRREGNIPCVLYSSKGNKHFSVTPLAVRDIIYTGAFKTANLQLDGNEFPAIVKDVQFHPVTEQILHIDFLQLEPNRTVKLNVPVAFRGVAPGVKAGGKLQSNMQKVKIKTTPEKMVGVLQLDISKLELGQAIRVRDIDNIEGVQIMSSPATPVATVEIPRALRSATAAELEDEKADEETAAAASAASAEAEGSEGSDESAEKPENEAADKE